MNSTLRVVMAGAGFASELHLAGWKRRPECGSRRNLRSGRRQSCHSGAKQFSVASVFGEAGAMLDEIRPDAIDIAAPMHEHVPLCLLAASKGVHILCQKPLAPSLAEAKVWRAQSTARCD